jgi:hypothetical protein
MNLATPLTDSASNSQPSSDATGATGRRTAVKLIWLFLATIVALLIRRPDQLLRPYLWVEDGRVNLPAFAAQGWSMVVEPIVGYLSVPMRAVFAIAASISFRWLPELLAALTVAATFAVVATIAMAPTLLRYRSLCAIAVLLVPTAPEVFGVSLYLLWWFSLLAVLPVLWAIQPGNHMGARVVLLIVGGLSSTLIIALLPLYLLRAALLRNAGEIIVLVIAIALAATQFSVMNSHGAHMELPLSWLSAEATVSRFLGMYPLWWPRIPYPAGYLSLGLAFAVFLALAIRPAAQNERLVRGTFVLLAALLVLTIAASILRVRPEDMHSVAAGPRYFFLPYAIISWLLIQIAANARGHWRSIAVILLLTATLNALVHGRARHPPKPWRTHVERCTGSDFYSFPIHYEGYAAHGITWSVTLSGNDCRRLLRRSLIDGSDELRASAP